MQYNSRHTSSADRDAKHGHMGKESSCENNLDNCTELIMSVEKEMDDVNQELDLQTEKYYTIQGRIMGNKDILYRNKAAIQKLKNRLKVNRFVYMIIFVLLIFLLSVFAMSYFHSIDFGYRQPGAA